MPGQFGMYGAAAGLRHADDLHEECFSRLDATAHVLAVYASRRGSPHAAQDSLLAAGQLCQAGLSPAGSRERFPSVIGQVMVILLSQAFLTARRNAPRPRHLDPPLASTYRRASSASTSTGSSPRTASSPSARTSCPRSSASPGSGSGSERWPDRGALRHASRRGCGRTNGSGKRQQRWRGTRRNAPGESGSRCAIGMAASSARGPRSVRRSCRARRNAPRPGSLAVACACRSRGECGPRLSTRPSSPGSARSWDDRCSQLPTRRIRR